MLKTDFIFAKCTKEGAPVPNILQIDFSNNTLTTIEWKDEKQVSDLVFNMPCPFDKMDCRDRTDRLWDIIGLYESKEAYIESANAIIKININNSNNSVKDYEVQGSDETPSQYVENNAPLPSSNSNNNSNDNDSDNDLNTESQSENNLPTAKDLVGLYESKHHLRCGHNYCNFLPEGLKDLGAKKGSNSRGCFVINGPDDIVTFYSWSGNDCVLNYTFNYKSGCELYTCAGPGNFKLLGSMKVEDFLEIAQYAGEKTICGGGHSAFKKRTDSIADEYQKIKSDK